MAATDTEPQHEARDECSPGTVQPWQHDVYTENLTEEADTGVSAIPVPVPAAAEASVPATPVPVPAAAETSAPDWICVTCATVTKDYDPNGFEPGVGYLKVAVGHQVIGHSASGLFAACIGNG